MGPQETPNRGRESSLPIPKPRKSHGLTKKFKRKQVRLESYFIKKKLIESDIYSFDI